MWNDSFDVMVKIHVFWLAYKHWSPKLVEDFLTWLYVAMLLHCSMVTTVSTPGLSHLLQGETIWFDFHALSKGVMWW